MDRTDPAGAGRRRFGVGAGVALVVLLALFGIKLWRAGLESSLWMDEVWSLGLVTLDWGDLVELARLDVNPPLYYLALKGWLGASGAVGLDPSVTTARSLNLVLWLALAASAAGIGRRLASPRSSWVLPLLVAGSAAAVQFTQDARPYGFAILGTGLCFLLAALDLRRRLRDRSRSSPRLWLAYALCALVALGSHVLCLPLIALVAGAWVAVGVGSGVFPEKGDRIAPVLGHAIPLVIALPWISIGLASGAALEAGDPGWLTPATFANLIRVFTQWMPLGRAGAAVGALSPLLSTLGVLCLASIAGAGFLLRPARSSSRRGARADLSLELFVAGNVVAILYVLLVWLVQRLGWFHVFYGPRYASLAVGVWTAGTAIGLAAVARRRGTGLALLLSSPWVAAALLSASLAGRSELRAGLAGQSDRILELARTSAAPVFFAPPRLGPFFETTLEGIGAAPLRELPCSLLASERAVLLQLNAWPQNDPPEQLLLRAAVARGRIPRLDRRPLPPSTGDFELWLLTATGGDRQLLERWCRDGITLRHPAPPGGAVAIALPENQRRSEGWSYLEFDERLRPFRWTAVESARVRFDRRLRPGQYRLRLEGYRSALPERVVSVRIGAPDGGWARELELGAGEFSVDLDLGLDQRAGSPLILEIRHPLWRPGGGGDREDERALGISIRRAVVLDGREGDGGGD